MTKQEELFTRFLKAYKDSDIREILKCFEEGLKGDYSDGTHNKPIDLLNKLPSKLLDDYVYWFNVLDLVKSRILSFGNSLYSTPLSEEVVDEVKRSNNVLAELIELNYKLNMVIVLIKKLTEKMEKESE